MEMISEFLIYGSIALATVAAAIFVLRWLDRKLRPTASPDPDELGFDLSDPVTIARLNRMLKKYGIVGDADIRSGIALAPVPPEKLDPLATVLMNAAAFISRLRNPAASSLYVRDSVNDRFMLLGDLDLDHLVDAARVMQRVAEDRRKSRSLYKGLTDDEMKSMVRAGMSQWLKDAGEFPESNEVMTGLWDDRMEFLMAMNVLDLLFKVKGVRND